MWFRNGTNQPDRTCRINSYAGLAAEPDPLRRRHRESGQAEREAAATGKGKRQWNRVRFVGSTARRASASSRQTVAEKIYLYTTPAFRIAAAHPADVQVQAPGRNHPRRPEAVPCRGRQQAKDAAKKDRGRGRASARTDRELVTQQRQADSFHLASGFGSCGRRRPPAGQSCRSARAICEGIEREVHSVATYGRRGAAVP
jgi:hypothetical protein